MTTRISREVSLTLVSDGSAHSEPVDYVLEYQPQRSFLISAAYPSVLIGESKTLGDDRPLIPQGTAKPDGDDHPSASPQLAALRDWHGKELRVAVARTEAPRPPQEARSNNSDHRIHVSVQRLFAS